MGTEIIFVNNEEQTLELSQIKQMGNYFFANRRKSEEDGNDSDNANYNFMLTMQRFVQFNSVFNAVYNSAKLYDC